MSKKKARQVEKLIEAEWSEEKKERLDKRKTIELKGLVLSNRKKEGNGNKGEGKRLKENGR